MIVFVSIGCGRSADSYPTASSREKQEAAASRIERISFASEALNKEMIVNVCLPEGYDSRKAYPVLYIIHGLHENENSWTLSRKINKKADELTGSQKINPLIIVSPFVENSWGISRYETYICKELVAYIDSHYSTLANRENRYIGGVSMGGFIALRTAFLHPDVYSKAGGHSPALVVGADPYLYPNLEIRNRRDPLCIAKDADLSELKIYLDCGDKDEYEFFEGCEKLYGILQDKGIEAEYHLGPGSHEDAYWEANMENYLMFYAGK